MRDRLDTTSSVQIKSTTMYTNSKLSNRLSYLYFVHLRKTTYVILSLFIL
jgi:hypothetical protein